MSLIATQDILSHVMLVSVCTVHKQAEREVMLKHPKCGTMSNTPVVVKKTIKGWVLYALINRTELSLVWKKYPALLSQCLYE